MTKADTAAEDILSKKMLDFQCRFIDRKYGSLAVRFVRCVSREDLTREKLKWMKPFLVMLRAIEKFIDI